MKFITYTYYIYILDKLIAVHFFPFSFSLSAFLLVFSSEFTLCDKVIYYGHAFKWSEHRCEGYDNINIFIKDSCRCDKWNELLIAFQRANWPDASWPLHTSLCKFYNIVNYIDDTQLGSLDRYQHRKEYIRDSKCSIISVVINETLSIMIQCDQMRMNRTLNQVIKFE